MENPLEIPDHGLLEAVIPIPFEQELMKSLSLLAMQENLEVDPNAQSTVGNTARSEKGEPKQEGKPTEPEIIQGPFGPMQKIITHADSEEPGEIGGRSIEKD
jgi:hypothetical protein